ncbi:MAG: NAD(P)/FAD-dependent oxidoreductase [Calditrichaeota bacterium]|nr:NAD(P)/FAD-dependent oxidoreductase [Calditrichota bacterium]RQW00087.1 MAG: NAD(P)/FAD-dependent oxidoreductase [Calditrichota bacterium]
MKNSLNFQLLVIGDGPAGMEAAIQGARRHLKVGLISGSQIGGRAIWSSLVPSKVWVHMAEKVLRVNFEANKFPPPTIDDIKNKIVQTSQEISIHYQSFLQRLGVEIIKGNAQYEGSNRVSVAAEGENEQQITADFIIIATGSEPAFFEGVKPNGDRIIAPRFTKQLQENPASLIMIGGGVTGCEYASSLAALGTEVTLVTDLPVLLPQMDSEIQQTLEESFLKRGIKLIKSSPVQKVLQEDSSVKVFLSDQQVLEADYAFLALGRKPDVKFLAENKNAIRLDNDGSIWTNGYQQTSEPHIYAVGDAAGGIMSANKALYQSRIAIAHIHGENIPAYKEDDVVIAVYTYPEIAGVGLTEQEAKSRNKHYKVIRKNYKNLIKYHLDFYVDGFMKLIVDAGSNKLLGAHTIGPLASELIAPVLVGKGAGLKYEELGSLPFAYPSFSEIALVGSHSSE